MTAIIDSDTLSEARSIIKSPTAQSAVALDRFAQPVKALAFVGAAGDVVELGVEMWKDPTIGTVVAAEANIGGAAAAAWVGGEVGAFVGAFGGPFAPVTIPVVAGLGAAGGALIYEFSGASEWVKINAKAGYNFAGDWVSVELGLDNKPK